MINFFKKYRDDAYNILKGKYDAEVARNQRCVRELELLNKQVFELQQQIKKDNYYNLAFDFSKIDAFSIERMPYNGEWITVIGYFDRQDQVREWYLHIDLDAHDGLVASFTALDKNKDQMELPV